MQKENKELLVAVVVIVLIAAFAYSATMSNGFTNWDDNHMVTENGMIRSLSFANLVHIFASMHYGHYHPLVVISYALEYHFFRLDPWIYHLTNVVFHILNTLLVFWFVRVLRGGMVIPLFAALVFGVHPLHVESVAWVTERKDMLYSFFYLLSLIAYVYYVRSNQKRFYIFAAVAFLCSVLSKAMAVTLPLALILVDFLLNRRFTKDVWIEKVPLFALSFLFGIIVLYATYPVKSAVVGASFGFDNILIAFHGLIFYPWKYLAPFHLSSLYPYPGRLGDPLPIEFTIAPFVVLVALVLVAFSLKKTKMVLFSVAFYVVTVAPVIQLTRVGGVIAADRFVYIPILGLILGTVEGIEWILRKYPGGIPIFRKLVIGVASVVVIFLSVLTRERTKVWKDSLTLWNDVLQQYTGLAVGYNNRGLAYADQLKFREAIDDYNAGLALESDDWRLLFNRANALRELGAYPQAVAEYNSALSKLPTNADIYYYRGLTYQYLGKMDNAVDDYNQAIKLNPARIEAYVNRGSIYAEAKQFDKALTDFNDALKLDPDDADVYFNRGAVYRLIARPDEALQEFSQSLSLKPSNAKALNFRGMTYFGKGEFDSAINDYEKAISIDPSNPFLYNNRGAAYYQKRDFDKAVSDYTVALSFAPNNIEALTNRAFAYCAMGRLDAARSDIAALKKLGAWIDSRLIELTGRTKTGTP
ncbi:MAG: tetratricopeptide repeat protein [Ignavibacteria bacterium]|nr:tetratricopeptide repeat protein [Ignavibacteria bacterium]